MEPFTIGLNEYRSGRLSAMQQFHVARRLLPVMEAVGAAFGTSTTTDDNAQPDWTTIIGPVADVVAKLSDADCEYVINQCMTVTQRRQGDVWAPVWNTRANAAQFQDIELPEMMQIVVHVLTDNLSGFISAGR